VVFVLGGPGAGKGTHCQRITSAREDFHFISAGDCLRRERSDPASAHGALIDEYIERGEIVPVEITIQLIREEMERASRGNEGGERTLNGRRSGGESGDCGGDGVGGGGGVGGGCGGGGGDGGSGGSRPSRPSSSSSPEVPVLHRRKHKFLIDGFPRNENNLHGWQRVVGNRADVVGMLLFECPEEALLQRVMQVREEEKKRRRGEEERDHMETNRDHGERRETSDERRAMREGRVGEGHTAIFVLCVVVTPQLVNAFLRAGGEGQ
jgi:UMP-CMP kinase